MTDIKIGQGYDVHRIIRGRTLYLGGIVVPWDKGLMGHSDADVLLHAIMDALLGAAGLGDIGVHFPDTDPAYEGADSKALYGRVIEMIEGKGYMVGNIDTTIVAQQPKLMKYIPQMREMIAYLSHVEESCVNVKATTEEKMGFTGSGEGMAAMAVCLLVKKPK